MHLPTIDREELRERLDRRDELVLVDALGPASFAFSRLPGAINLPPERVDQLAARRIPDKDVLVVVYCANPACESSVDTGRRLIELGYTNVVHYPGGKSDWITAGLPVEP